MASNFSKSDNAIADLHKAIWRIIVCHNLWGTNAPRISNNLVIFKHLYSWYFNLETNALSQMLLIKTDAKYQGGKKKKHTGQDTIIFHVSLIFSSCFLESVFSGDRFCPGCARTRGHHKARVTFERSSELFNPKHKTSWLSQNGIPFQMSPCCCLFPCCVYLTLFTAGPKAHTRCCRAPAALSI